MFHQGNILFNNHTYYLVISNDWVNSNSKIITILPTYLLKKKPKERRRTHLVVNSIDHHYLVHCEDIKNINCDDNNYFVYDSISENDIQRVRNRLRWMYGGEKDAKGR